LGVCAVFGVFLLILFKKFVARKKLRKFLVWSIKKIICWWPLEGGWVVPDLLVAIRSNLETLTAFTTGQILDDITIKNNKFTTFLHIYWGRGAENY